MKKILCIVLSILMLSTVVSYTITSLANITKANENNSSQSKSTTEKNSDKTEDTKKAEKNTSAATNNSTSNSNINFDAFQGGNKNVLRRVSTEIISVPKNLKAIATNDNTDYGIDESVQAAVTTYDLNGNIVDWTVKNDVLYVITKTNNRLTVINSNDLNDACYASLSATPAEMNIVDDKIYVSLPSLKRIDVFSKADCKLLSSMLFEHEVSSFCVDGVFIYYTENEGWCHVYRKNIVTNKVVQINDNNSLFSDPKIYLNKEDGILYVGETFSSGCALYYYDAKTLNFMSKFEKNDYGISNKTRKLFHVGNNVYWGGYCISDTNAEELRGRFGTDCDGSMLYASEKIISTNEGLFDANTYEYIVNYSEAKFDYKQIIVSESGKLFFKQNNTDETVIVNLKLQ